MKRPRRMILDPILIRIGPVQLATKAGVAPAQLESDLRPRPGARYRSPLRRSAHRICAPRAINRRQLDWDSFIAWTIFGFRPRIDTNDRRSKVNHIENISSVT